MTRWDVASAVIMATIITTVDGQILNGPHLGLVGYLFEALSTAVGWFVGLSIVKKLEDQSNPKKLWILTLVSSLLIFGLVSTYYIFVVAGKTSYSKWDIFLHVIVLFVVGVAARTMYYAATTASSSNSEPKKGHPTQPS